MRPISLEVYDVMNLDHQYETVYDVLSLSNYLNPAHNNAIEKKLGYVMKIDDSWWLGSGIYTGTAGM